MYEESGPPPPVTDDTQLAEAAAPALELPLPFAGLDTLNGQKAAERWAERIQDIAVHSPETAQVLADKQIIAFHGATSATVLSTLEHGLLSGEEQLNRDIPVTGGEWLFQAGGGQKSVSFTEIMDAAHLIEYCGSGVGRTIEGIKDKLALGHETLAHIEGEGGLIKRAAVEQTIAHTEAMLQAMEADPDSAQTKLVLANIPIVWGLSQQSAMEHQVYTRSGEYRVPDGVPIDEISVVAVPRQQVDYMKELCAYFKRDITVLPMEDILFRPGNEELLGQRFEYGKGLVEDPTVVRKPSRPIPTY